MMHETKHSQIERTAAKFIALDNATKDYITGVMDGVRMERERNGKTPVC